jgi:hypothetical protein
MSKKISEHRKLTEELIAAGYKSVAELIKVAEAPIIKGSKKAVAGELMIDFTDDLGVEKMKNAAAAKKLAIFDAYDILDKIKEKQDGLDSIDGKLVEKEQKQKITSIPSAESRAS